MATKRKPKQKTSAEFTLEAYQRLFEQGNPMTDEEVEEFALVLRTEIEDAGRRQAKLKTLQAELEARMGPQLRLTALSQAAEKLEKADALRVEARQLLSQKNLELLSNPMEVEFHQMGKVLEALLDEIEDRHAEAETAANKMAAGCAAKKES